MSQFADVLAPEDNRLVQEVTALTNRREFDAALTLISKRLDQGIDIATQQGACLTAELAGKLIDIGSHGHIEEAAQKGIDLYESERVHFKKYVSDASIEYNLGNGKGALFHIGRAKEGFEFKPETMELLVEEKNHFWKSHKLFGLQHDYLRSQLLVNLANALSYSGRIVEALQYRD